MKKQTTKKEKKFEFKGGVYLNEKDNRDIYVTDLPKYNVASASVLPDEFLPDVSYLTIYNQLFGTCVSHQIAEEKQEQEYKEMGKIVDFSRRYHYALTRRQMGLPDTSEGLAPRLADKILCEYGICLSETIPEQAKTHLEYTSVTISDDVIKGAKKYRVSDNFVAVPVTEHDIKQSIITFRGVGTTLPYSWGAWNVGKSGILGSPVGQGTQGYHRIRLVGYRIFNKRLQFKFQNSWSKNWGENGFGYFYFDEYQAYMMDLSVYTDVPNDLLEKAKSVPYIFNINLKKGMSGYDVLQLQKRLDKEVVFPYFTGFFGIMTQDAVKKYQKKNGLSVDGNVGPKTRACLNGTKYVAPAKKTLLDALVQLESNGNDFAIGDLKLKNKAYGCLQIRQPYVDDVNKAFGTTYKAEQMLGNRELSFWVYEKYMALYATEKNIGGPVTDEHKARIHNGGPKGFTYQSTVVYWDAIKKIMQ